MLWLRFSIICFLFSAPVFAGKFTSEQCVQAKFKTQIGHDGKFFGLIKNELKLQKEECIIHISFKNVLETKWKIDICREPIHIKVTAKGTQSVYKRNKKCDKKDQTEYCSFYNELDEILQDHGLIFADGEREDLNTSHGQAHCTYLLVKRYLKDGILFSKYDNPINIFSDDPKKKDQASCDLPEAKMKSSSSSAIPSSIQVEKIEDSIIDKADKLIEDVTDQF